MKKNIQEEIEKLAKEKSLAIQNQNYDLALLLRDRMAELQIKLKKKIMTKIILTNQQDFESILTELKSDEGTELTFDSEETPKLFPCILIYHHSDDVDFGSVYDIAFVYASDFG